MSDNRDFVIDTQMRVPDGSIISEKPKYLLILEEKGKNKEAKKFLAVEQIGLEAAYVKAKGFFIEGSEEEIITNFRTFLKDAPKESGLELYLPWHSVSKIQSLMFKMK